MALLGKNGEYLKIESIVIDSNYVCTINYKIYANEEHRRNGDSEFLNSKIGGVNSGLLQTKLSELADANLSIIDNLKKAGYEAIKGDTFEISSWTDC